VAMMLVKRLRPMGVDAWKESSSMSQSRERRVDMIYFWTRVLFSVSAKRQLLTNKFRENRGLARAWNEYF
jgi:hypothetical protein